MLRFIPTSAGNIAYTPISWNGNTVHPHECGEHAVWRLAPILTSGSSPRVRGTFYLIHQPNFCHRFIPTSAGNMMGYCPRPPHRFGSSPRVRGTYRLSGGYTRVQRFIPTSAGNIVLHRTVQGIIPVHPHECGEHILVQFTILSKCGSSPRVRGTSRPAIVGLRLWRFIPTSAGNIVVGEQVLVCCPGSSPRVRGTFVVGEQVLVCCPVHPHECGEHTPEILETGEANGSSPRVRGTCVSVALCVRQGRFIPTSAGNMNLSGSC